MAFAKLYGNDDNQVLVKLDQGEDGPEVRFYFKPDGLGVCSVASEFEDTDEGWDAAESAFEKVNEEMAISTVGKMKAEFVGMLLGPSLITHNGE